MDKLKLAFKDATEAGEDLDALLICMYEVEQFTPKTIHERINLWLQELGRPPWGIGKLMEVWREAMDGDYLKKQPLEIFGKHTIHLN